MDIQLNEQFGSQYFEATEDGMEIGEVAFRTDDSGKHMTITHVGINPQFRGGGRAKELVMHVVDYARKNGIKITPQCTYARAVFERYADELQDVRYSEQV